MTHILNMSWEAANFFPDDFVYMKLTISDYKDQKIFEHFNAGFEFIGKSLLV